MIIKMLTLILLMNFEYKCDEFIKYEKAFDYIKESSIVKELFMQSENNPMDTILFHVSDKLNTYSPGHFPPEILDYEYKDVNDSLKEIILDSLWHLSSSIDDFTRIDEFSELKKLNTSKEFNMLLFFSKISENKLNAEIFRYIPRLGIDHNKYWFGTSIHFLFYFKEDVIEKVFYVVVVKGL